MMMKTNRSLLAAVALFSVSGLVDPAAALADEQGPDGPAAVAYCKSSTVQDDGAAYACAFAWTAEQACSGGTPGRVDKRDIQTTDPQAAQCPDGSWVTRFELK